MAAVDRTYTALDPPATLVNSMTRSASHQSGRVSQPGRLPLAGLHLTPPSLPLLGHTRGMGREIVDASQASPATPPPSASASPDWRSLLANIASTAGGKSRDRMSSVVPLEPTTPEVVNSTTANTDTQPTYDWLTVVYSVSGSLFLLFLIILAFFILRAIWSDRKFTGRYRPYKLEESNKKFRQIVLELPNPERLI